MVAECLRQSYSATSHGGLSVQMGTWKFSEVFLNFEQFIHNQEAVWLDTDVSFYLAVGFTSVTVFMKFSAFFFPPFFSSSCK